MATLADGNTHVIYVAAVKDGEVHCHSKQVEALWKLSPGFHRALHARRGGEPCPLEHWVVLLPDQWHGLCVRLADGSVGTWGVRTASRVALHHTNGTLTKFDVKLFAEAQRKHLLGKSSAGA
jgi:hypothetical protein